MAEKLIANLKIETKSFVTSILQDSNMDFGDRKVVLEESLRCITKQLLLYKIIYLDNDNLDFLDSMIYSILMTLKITFSAEWFPEQHDLYVRIFIEHFIKMMADVKRDTRQEIPAVIATIKETVDMSRVSVLLDALYSTYRDTSGSVHGGKLNMSNLSLYYNELNKPNLLTVIEILKQIECFQKNLLTSTELLILIKKDLLNEVFYKRIIVLKHLLPKNMYETYSEYLIN